MAINPRTGAVLGGAVIGAYTSDVSENPITGGMSTIIGAGIGGVMSLPDVNLRSMVEVPKEVKQDSKKIIKTAAKGASEVDNKINGFNKYLDTLKARLTPSGDQLKDLRIGLEKTNLQKIRQKLGHRNSPDPLTHTDEFINYLRSIKDPRVIEKISPLFNLDVTNKIVDVGSKNLPKIESFTARIDDNLKYSEKVSQLSEYLSKNLGNSPEDAIAKAELIVSRSIGPIHITDGVVTINDVNDKGKAVGIPITSRDSNGVRWHNSGNGRAQSVKGFTPFASSYIKENGKVNLRGTDIPATVDRMLEGLDPEYALKHLDPKAPVSNVLEMMRSLRGYDSNEVHTELFDGRNFTATSPKFIENSNKISFEHTFDLDIGDSSKLKNTYKPYRKLRKTATTINGVPEHASEVVRARGLLAIDVPNASSLAAGVSNNTTTDIQTLGRKTLSIIPDTARNLSNVREEVPTNPTVATRAIKNALERNSRDGYASAQAINKLDVINKDLFNRLASSLTEDSSITLADGFGLFNRDHSDQFKIQNMSEIVIPRAGTGNVILKDGILSDAFNSQEGINEFIKNKGAIKVTNDQVIGYDNKGKEVKLPNMYTEGFIESAYINKDNDLVFRTRSVFDPKKENLIKTFSTGSKSLAGGVNGKEFSTLASLASLLNKGDIVLDTDKLLPSASSSDLIRGIFKDGINIDNVKSLLSNDLYQNSIANQYKDIALLTGGEYTGTGSLVEALSNTDGTKANEMLNIKEVSKLLPKDYSVVDKKNAIITSQLLTKTKGSEDLMGSLHDSLLSPLYRVLDNTYTDKDLIQLEKFKNSGLLDSAWSLDSDDKDNLVKRSINNISTRLRRSREESQYINPKTRDKAVKELHSLVSQSSLSTDLTEGRSIALGSLDLGEAKVGAGNRAKMSWNGLNQMIKSGYSMDQIKTVFGEVDDNVLYELGGYLKEGSIQQSGINKYALGREKELVDMLKLSPEERYSRIKSEFPTYREKSPYVSYNLNVEHDTVKSINFAIKDTSRHGVYDNNGKLLTKELEKRQLAILSTDIKYSQEKDKAKKESIRKELSSMLDEYNKYRFSSLKGDNSLLKNGIAINPKGSATMILRPTGGQANAYSKKFTTADRLSSVFLSEEGLKNHAFRQGVKFKDIYYKDVEEGFETLKQPFYRDKLGKEVPLSMLITRQPAQGDLSTTMSNIILDRSIKGGSNSLYVGAEQKDFVIGKGADFDKDTVQTFTANMNKKQYASLKTTQIDINGRHYPLLDMEKDMSPKGGSKELKSITEFSSLQEFHNYQFTSDFKGKVRKDLSPLVTSLAQNWSDAVSLEYSTDSIERTKGSIASYRAVESILKTSHKDTSLFTGGNVTDAEALHLAREQFLKDGVKSKYKAVLENLLPAMLGKREGDASSAADEFSKIVIDAELNRARQVSRTPSTPLDLGGYSDEARNTVKSILDNSGVVEMERGIEGTKSIKQLYNETGDVIVNTFKKNKGLILGGVGAIAAINMLGRSGPNFDEDRYAKRMPAANMMATPKTMSEDDVGINPNRQKTGYVTPKEYSNRNVNVSGQFTNSYDNYEDTSNSLIYQASNQMNSLNTAIFGGDIRRASLSIQDI